MPELDMETGKVRALKELDPGIRARAETVGMDGKETCRSGSFFQMDQSVLLASTRTEDLELTSTPEALERYGWLSDYCWNVVPSDTDRFTRQVQKSGDQGFFIRVLPGARVELPLQACLFMGRDRLTQRVHNIVIAEEGSELHIINGCTAGPRVRSGFHLGVTEFYVKEGAHVTTTMIHNWAEDVGVRPRSGALVGKDAAFLSNYVCMNPVRTLQMYPTAYCSGENSVARFNTILSAPRGSAMDVGARVYLQGGNSRAEVISRAITTGGKITARGHLIGEVPGVKAHLECRGLILSERGNIHAIPELEGKVKDIDMSHEAAVGRIAQEEITYLMARGLSPDEATSAIVRGFLDVETKGLPDTLREEIKRAVQAGNKALF